MNDFLTFESASCELYLPPIQVTKKYNPVNGQFLKGHIPVNKGCKISKEIIEKLRPTMFKKGNISTRKYSPDKKAKPVEMWKVDRIVGVFDSITGAAKRTGIQRVNIKKVLKGERKNAGGFQWVYQYPHLVKDLMSKKTI